MLIPRRGEPLPSRSPKKAPVIERLLLKRHLNICFYYVIQLLSHSEHYCIMWRPWRGGTRIVFQTHFGPRSPDGGWFSFRRNFSHSGTIFNATVIANWKRDRPPDPRPNKGRSLGGAVHLLLRL
jgi:hypothetical protein